MNPQRETVSIGVAASLLGITPSTLRRWAKDGKVRHFVMPSGRLRFLPADVEALMRQVDQLDRTA